MYAKDPIEPLDYGIHWNQAESLVNPCLDGLSGNFLICSPGNFVILD